MKKDPIVDEVRRVRDRLAARFNYDLDAMFADLKACEKASGWKHVHHARRLLKGGDAKTVVRTKH